ncbi:MAG TPA: M23 family metallopeptidase [Candidatus Saccharimonadales bacterium]|nr:M23 family metallopeptidase [Candidatus Saccharimonadales bacterium]
MSLFLVLFAQGCINTINLQSQTATSTKTTTVYYSEQPTALGASLDEAAHVIGQDLSTAGSVAAGGLRHVGSIIVVGGKAAADIAHTIGLGVIHGVQATVTAIGRAIMFTVRTMINAVVFVLHIPISLFGFITESKVVSALITPAADSHNNDVPIIDPNDPALLAAQKALPAIDPAVQTPEYMGPQEIAWPIHGAITTHFGEKGRYYHPTHTGIDISDGKRSGVTPIKAYRRGTVIAAGRDGGLGNRVIVDHGNGVTSVYGHMYSIAVQVGQQVDTTSTLGTEGSTGVSTGTHLHFEIRINGQAADPLLFIAGRP